MGLEAFSPAVREWFAASFPAPTPAQEKGWPAIASGAHTLVLAPTGSGKTLAAFLWGLDRLIEERLAGRTQTRLLYLSPLKALNYDVERNLRGPLAGLADAARRRGLELPAHAVAGTKRGAHLALSLERLERAAGGPVQRIGLSATQRPLEEIARFLGGRDDGGRPRPVTIVDAGSRKELDIEVLVPVEDMAELGRP